MAFADNLKQIRKAHGLSQEALAELLQVSRQAVSKWESGNGYPEVDMLLLLSKELHVSLDDLMNDKTETNMQVEISKTKGELHAIQIVSFDGKKMITCRNIVASGCFRVGNDQPRYALFGNEGTISSWGPQNVLLGWYVNEAAVQEEIKAIQQAMKNGEVSYTLMYASKVKRKWWNVVLDKNNLKL